MFEGTQYVPKNKGFPSSLIYMQYLDTYLKFCALRKGSQEVPLGQNTTEDSRKYQHEVEEFI